jgi:microcin C transport system substrate-binding protein
MANGEKLMRVWIGGLLMALLLAAPGLAQARSDALSLMAAPKLPVGFTHFPYVNPDAPKGGSVTLSTVGTFDSFNPFIVRGSAASGISQVWDTLMRANADEAEAMYCHLCQSIAVAPDGMSVTFVLRPEARFHDGTPVTAEDVAWTFNTLRKDGRPNYSQYYSGVDHVTVDGERQVTFHFKAANRELPMILGQLAVLPEHWWKGRDFSKPLTDPPLGSGPYKVGAFEFGRHLVLERVADYWAKDLPTAKGLANFGAIRTEYFRDATVALEAFKAGQVDFRTEQSSKDWATAYDFPAVARGLVKKEMLRHRLPTGMQGFAMNTRRPLFKDVRVRHALALVFDFEWENANLFFDAYTRTESYFSNSDLASSGVPQGAELALLEPFRDQLPATLFTEPFKLPVTDGRGNNRAQLTAALALLREAGWHVHDRKLVNAEGQPFQFEILLSQAAFERVALPYVQWLGRLGITARVRTVDPAQYQRQMDNYDYDMTVTVIPESESPGNEQIGFWTCGSAKQVGGDNLMGVCSPVVDALVHKVVAAPDRAALLAATHALDRVLLWGWYMVPQWHLQGVRVAYWNRFGRPAQPVRTGLELNSWWIDPVLSELTEAARRAGK